MPSPESSPENQQAQVSQPQPVQPDPRRQHWTVRWPTMIVLLVVIAVIVVALLPAHKSAKAPAATRTETVKSLAVVSITEAGFSPATIKVSPGTTVTWTDNDTQPHWVASDPYPTDTGLSGFNAREALQNGDQYSFTFAKTGTFTYHDQLNPYTFKGSVVVQ